MQGSTELTVLPLDAELRTIHLHCRQAEIHRVSVASYPAEFVLHDPFKNLGLSGSDPHYHPELKRKVYSALAEGDQGELSIAIPPEVHIRYEASTSATPAPEFAPLKVVIEYSLTRPEDGLQYMLPTTAYPYRVPHVYTSPSSAESARSWVPCVDNMWARCAWDFEIIVPRHLEQVDEDDDEERAEGETGGRHPVVVACSGEFLEQIDHPLDPRKTIFLYSLDKPTSVQQIAWAAGPFHILQIQSDKADDGSPRPVMHAFCLPGQERQLAASVTFMRLAMEFYRNEFGSYPHKSHKLVFVNDLPENRFDSAAMSLVSSDFLHGEDAIDSVFESRQLLSHALACQWLGVHVYPKTWSDLWLVNGLGLYMTGLFLKRHLGNNEYRFRMRKDMDRVVEMDSGEMPPLCQPMNLNPPDNALLTFINMKAALVLHSLDRRLSRSGTSLGIPRVLSKMFLQAVTNDQQAAASTQTFFKLCRKLCNFDARAFAEQWIYGSGCPRMRFKANFNRKRMAVEITVQQHSPAFEKNKNDPVRMQLLRPVELFEGHMTVRIHEADGTPYEHVLDVQTPFKKYDVPFNTKYKRVRRNTKRFIARQAAAAAAAQGDTDAAEAIGMIDVGFALDLWEDTKERENWKVSDWTEEDEQKMAQATYEWIRMDADFEWITIIIFDQPDFMWVSQLQRDRDVVAQLEAVRALSHISTGIVSSSLTKTVLVTNYFHRVRAEAAMALVNCATDQLKFIGLFHLFKIFLRYCHQPPADQDLFSHKYVPQPNDFSDFSEYFVRKAVVTAISRVRFANGKTPGLVRRFLIDQLRYNDNTNNSYSDARYISCIIHALAGASMSTAPPEHGQLSLTHDALDQNDEDRALMDDANKEISRYSHMDRLVPSSHNVVTIAILKWRALLALACLIPNDPNEYLKYTREGNSVGVRIAAFEGLLLTRWFSAKLLRYLLLTIQYDASRVVRRSIARALLESLMLQFAMGEIKSAKEDNVLVEEDGSVQDKSKELLQKKNEINGFIKTLRKDRDLGKSKEFRDHIMPILMDPNVDAEVRWSMLQLNELFTKGREETVPKVMLHIPITPVAETPPSLSIQPHSPALPLILKAQRRQSIATPTTPKLPFTLKPPTLKVKDEPVAKPTVPDVSPVPARVKIKVPPKPQLTVDTEPVRPAAPVHRPAGTVKKAKPQQTGMSSVDIKACRNALHRLNQNKFSVIFRVPVDPIRDLAPNYYEKITIPMDLSTMRSKLDAGVYTNRDQFEADFRQMVKNAKEYTPNPEIFAHQQAVGLETFFNQAWGRILATLASATHGRDAAVQKQPAIPTPVAPVSVPRPPQQRSSSSVKPPRPTASAMPPPPPPAPTKLKLKLGRPPPASPVEQPPAPSPKPPIPSPPAPVVVKTAKVKDSAKVKDPAKVKDDFDDLELELMGESRDDEDAEGEDADPFLEEIMLIEKAVKPGHPPPKKEKAPPAPALVIARPRAPPPDLDMDLEEIIAAPAPSAHVPAPVSVVSPPVPAPAPVRPAPSHPVVKLKVGGSSKPSTPKPQPQPQPQPQPRVATPQPQVQAPPPPRPVIKKSPPTSAVSTTRTPMQKKKCQQVLRFVKDTTKHPLAWYFLEPVDAVALGVPTYYDEIKQPMDFRTLQGKLDHGDYTHMEDFEYDMRLIFQNARQFNPPGTDVHNAATACEEVFDGEWAKQKAKLSYEERRHLSGVLGKLRNEDVSIWFREPVDPVRLNIPHYYQIVPQRDARDISTIKSKLDRSEYDTSAAVFADIQLMVDNCMKFNGPDHEVSRQAKACQQRFHDMLADASRKRKQDVMEGTPVASSSSNKKQRTG